MALRIDDVIRRRNDLIHRPLESYDVVAAIMTGNGMDAVVRRVETISEDCDKLAREILPTAYPVIEQVSGRSFEELAATLMSLDVERLEDDEVRAELERARDLMSILGWASPKPNSTSPAERLGEEA